jgi:integral membrane sensor domain MASE1
MLNQKPLSKQRALFRLQEALRLVVVVAVAAKVAAVVVAKVRNRPQHGLT